MDGRESVSFWKAPQKRFQSRTYEGRLTVMMMESMSSSGLVVASKLKACLSRVSRFFMAVDRSRMVTAWEGRETALSHEKRRFPFLSSVALSRSGLQALPDSQPPAQAVP